MTVDARNRKHVISVLWISLAVMMSASLLLYLYAGGGEVLDGIRAGVVEGEEITTSMELMVAAFWLVPLAMAVLTLTLPWAVNRWANVVLGLAIAVLDGMDAVPALTEGTFGGEALVVVVMTLVGVLIAWLGFRLPKPQPREVGRTSEPVREHAHV
jgi:hypothetical protein